MTKNELRALRIIRKYTIINKIKSILGIEL